jgi:hypothetical protein
MNQRVLVSGGLRVGDPARALIGAALAEITGQSIEVFEERLSGPTPWLLDLPTEAEAVRLAEWALATAGVRTMRVPAVGAPAPSRAAGLAFLESRLGVESGRERAQVEAEDAEQVRRQAEAQKKARALAEDRAPAPREARQSGPIRPQAGGERLELDDAETAMFWRIADMRDMLAENSRRGAAKALAAKAREMGRTGGDRDRVEASALSASLRASLGAPSDDFAAAAAAGAAAAVAAPEAINVYATRVLPAPADDEDEDEEGARD